MMNLADMLSYADINQLHRIADHYACVCDGHSKHELIQSILSKVYRKEGFQNVVQHLNDEDLRFLNGFLFEPHKSFSLEELVARAKYTVFEQVKSTEGKQEIKRRSKQVGKSKKNQQKSTELVSP